MIPPQRPKAFQIESGIDEGGRVKDTAAIGKEQEKLFHLPSGEVIEDVGLTCIDGLALKEAAARKDSGITEDGAFQGVSLSGITPKLQDLAGREGSEFIDGSHTAVSMRFEATRVTCSATIALS